MLSEIVARSLLGGRWRLLHYWKRGAAGEVWLAEDLVGGGTVVVKFQAPTSTTQLARVRREIAALRILRLPGIVNILDDGAFEEQHYIAMELVEGHDFPGTDPPLPWPVLEPLAVSLLQTMAGVHAAGIIHRDLKPQNVLVTSDGGVRVLDFGLARGQALGETITLGHAMMGTPRYIAPEQINGSSDARSDLFAIGVMLFEALTGQTPHPGTDLAVIVHNRLHHDAPPIAVVQPDLEPAACRLVDALLQRDPRLRPRSANEALALLSGARSRPPLRRLGSLAAIDRLVAAASAGRCCDVLAPAGGGRTRALHDAADRLLAQGRAVHWVVASSRPYGSIIPVVGPPQEHKDVPGEMQRRLRGVLGNGAILVVDERDMLDRWSVALLDACLDAGGILGMGTEVEELRPLEEPELRELFHGPDRVLHLREDGARELFRRAGGWPGRVAAEVDAWLAAGLVRLDEDRLRIERATIERLAGGLHIEPALPGSQEDDDSLADLLAWVGVAWPHASDELLGTVAGLASWELTAELTELERRGRVRRRDDGRWEPVAGVAAATAAWGHDRRERAHAAMAAALLPGTEGRLAHLVFSADLRAAAAEALLVGQRLASEGHLSRASGVFGVGLMVARSVEGAPGEEALLVALAEVSVLVVDAAAHEATLLEFSRAHAGSPLLDDARGLLRASLAAIRGDARTAIEGLRGLGPISHDALEETRLGELQRLLAVHRPDEVEVSLALLDPWVGTCPRREGLRAHWLARHRYRQERYDEAAELNALSATRVPRGPVHFAALLGQASALLDSGRFDAARTLATDALRLSAEARLAHIEARAEWILRSAAYRAGELIEVDDELIEACGLGTLAWVFAQVLTTEAAVAWRRAERERTIDLAVRAHRCWEQAKFGPAATLVAALRHAAQPAPVPPALLQAALDGPVPGLALQALGLLASVDSEARALARERIVALVEAVPAARRAIRLEVLAPREALSYALAD